MELQATQRLKVHFKANDPKNTEKQAIHLTRIRIARKISANRITSQMAIQSPQVQIKRVATLESCQPSKLMVNQWTLKAINCKDSLM